MFLGRTIIKNLRKSVPKVILYLIIIFLQPAAFGYQTDTLPLDLHQDVVKITRSWELPATLKNISAIDYISSGRMACLQDEIGSIFILNLESGEIEKEYPFGPPGDYEGLVLVKKNAYVACADGRILEIVNYNSESPSVTEYGTHLTVNENVNGLSYDKKNKRLLVSIKEAEDANQMYTGIYAFSLVNKRMPVKPVIRIDLRNKVFDGLPAKNVQTKFQPSDLDINPATGILYIIDANRCQLLSMKMPEDIKDLAELNRENFFQPEGITFTPSGEMFIACRGEREEPGKLLQLRIK
jgi:uncharacterized protein YjiK